MMYKNAALCAPLLPQGKTIINQNSTAMTFTVLVATPVRYNVDHALLSTPMARYYFVGLLWPGHVDV
jgi:hypothetical protein